MDAHPTDSESPTRAAWSTREQYWKRKLGRIRLGAEPVDEQLAKYQRVTWGLTAVALGLAVMFLGLFTAFERTDVGAVLVAILLLPVVVLAWLDFAILRSRVRAYLREREQHFGR